ncbi:MAG: WXG100 family type VII secretion target, partial [Acidimicrobiales bacterium]
SVTETTTSPDADAAAALMAITRADEVAESATRIAEEIQRLAGQLSPTLDPMWHLHTPRTWVGDAATAARTRLEGHGLEIAEVVARLRRLASELDTAATASDRLARDLREGSSNP